MSAGCRLRAFAVGVVAVLGVLGGLATPAAFAGPATHLMVSAPASATAGSPFSITVTALDSSEAVATGYRGTVHFTNSDNGSGSVVPADYAFVAGDNGVHTFTNAVTLVTAGSRTVTATDTANASITGTSNTVSVSPATATHFAVSAPASATAGSPFSITLTALDQFNNTATGYRGTVHFTKTDGGSGSAVPADYTFVAGDNGVHTFTNGVTLVTAGSRTVSATDTANASITGSNTISVSPGAATHFAVSAPASRTAGSPFSVTVSALDQFDNTTTGYRGTVHFTSSDSGSGVAVPSDYTFVVGDNGVHTFTNAVTLVTAGSRTVTATDTATASITGTSNAISVSPATATHLAVSAPGSATAGSPFSITVTALDQFNNTATGYRGAVHFTKTDSGSGSAVPADYTFVAGDNGVHTFTNGVTLVTAGSRTVTATDTANASITGTSGSVSVSPATATHLAVSAPGSATAGSPFSITITAQDQFDNTATGYRGTVHFANSDNGSGSAVPADYTFLAGDNGAHTFTGGVTLVTAGSQTVTATDTITSSITGSNTITVGPPATHFSITAPSSSTAGVGISLTVTALDASDHAVPAYSGHAHFTSSDGDASLPGDSTLTNGTGTFSVTLRTAGNQTISATDTTTTSISGMSSAIAVSPAATTRFAVSAPASATAGSPLTLTVTALDPFGNTATGFAGTVHFTSSDGSATLPANSTLSNGTGTFSAILKTAGNRTITATDTSGSPITGTSDSVAVSPAAAAHFAVSAPSSATAGHSFGVTIVARDEFGNTATSYVGLVHFTSSDPRATLPPDSPLVQGGGGFAVTLVTAGNQTIAATDARVPSLAGTSGPVSVPLPVPRFLLGRGLRATLGKDNMFVVPGVSAQCPVGAPTGCRMTGSAIAAGSRPRAARRPAAQMLATAVSLKLTGGETRSVVMRLTRAGALRLRKQGSAKLTATITLRVVGGPSRAVTRTFTLRTRTVPPR